MLKVKWLATERAAKAVDGIRKVNATTNAVYGRRLIYASHSHTLLVSLMFITQLILKMISLLVRFAGYAKNFVLSQSLTKDMSKMHKS